ncbi:MAG: hypothetical protein RIF33_14505 [Cyclobacteriaceae bacterium]
MNRSKALAVILSITFSSISPTLAQEKVDLAPTQFTVSFLPLMAHLESKLTDHQSVTFGGGLAYSAYYSEINGEGEFEFYTTPFLTASLRNYYNRKFVRKDNLKQNSGNYVAFLASYQFDTIADIDGLSMVETDLNSFTIGPVWGFQRNYGSGIHFDLSIGLGYRNGQSNEVFKIEEGLTFIGGFELGFRL